MNLNDHSHSFNEEFLPLITNPEIDTSASSEVLYEFKVDNKPIEIVSQAQSGTDQSKNLNLLNLSDVLEHNIGDELIFESNVLDADNQTDFLDSTSAITTVSTAACTTPTIDKYSELQECQTFSQAVIGKENDSICANIIETDAGNPFDDAFKMPTNYLPKKKKD
ncbi:GSCOCG00011683001-RA-CDS [Cotesia congregata]|nr:GSCOCG00011683001-RA-CDS [Cotesia congregata]